MLEACDALDGVKDGVLEDPTRCHFDPKVIECKGADGPDCLTAPQVETAAEIYPASKNPRTRQEIFPGSGAGQRTGLGRHGWPAAVRDCRRSFQVRGVQGSELGLADSQFRQRCCARREDGQRHDQRDRSESESLLRARRKASAYTTAGTTSTSRRGTASTTTRPWLDTMGGASKVAGFRTACSWCPGWRIAGAAMGPTHSTCQRHRAVGGKGTRRPIRSSPRTSRTAQWTGRARCARIRRWRAIKDPGASTKPRISFASSSSFAKSMLAPRNGLRAEYHASKEMPTKKSPAKLMGRFSTRRLPPHRGTTVSPLLPCATLEVRF